MSKAILVLEMPEHCDKCYMCQVAVDSELYEDGERFCCLKIESVEEQAQNGSKPDWCPLRPLPERKPRGGTVMVISGSEHISMTKALQEAHNIGWNYCIDEIEGR